MSSRDSSESVDLQRTFRDTVSLEGKGLSKHSVNSLQNTDLKYSKSQVRGPVPAQLVPAFYGCRFGHVYDDMWAFGCRFKKPCGRILLVCRLYSSQDLQWSS